MSNKFKHWSLEWREIYCRAKRGEWLAHAQKTWTPQLGLKEEILKSKLGEGLHGEWLSSDWLVVRWLGGRWSKNLSHQPSGSSSSGVHVLVLSLMLPSPIWMRALISREELRDKVSDCNVYPLRRNQDTAPFLNYFFLSFSFFFLFIAAPVAYRSSWAMGLIRI